MSNSISNSGYPDENPDKPHPLDDEPIPFDDTDMSDSNISHSPLNLGGSDQGEASKPKQAKEPTKATAKVVSTDRITGVKTFFGKLHVGSVGFVDEQITEWLKNNPDIVIKRANTATGMLIGKTTEPNILITVWY